MIREIAKMLELKFYVLEGKLGERCIPVGGVEAMEDNDGVDEGDVESTSSLEEGESRKTSH